MTNVTAKLSNFRTAPRKVRLVADLVRGKKVVEAKARLSFTTNKSARTVLKLVNAAVDAAKKNHQIDENNLYISKITVDEGPKLKRWHPMSRGRAYPIEKKTSHIMIVLSETNLPKEEKKEERAEVKAKPTKKATKPKKTTKKTK
jgi:large subunit ribosomal protein L22